MEVISTRRYEAGPPTDAHSGILVDPEKSVATIKEEEWETRKKKEITTTRQIETRVKRQVVLEDGEVVVDSGPLVTTNTTEDVEQQEHTTQERRTTGDDPKAVEWRDTNGGLVQKELNETVVRSREEIEELLETEDRRQLGDITDEAYLKAIRSNRGDLRVALAECSKELDSGPAGPRVVQHTTKSNKVVDTEKTREKKELKSDGGIVTETEKTVEHEEIKDDEVPDDPGASPKSDVGEETRKSASQRFAKTREEDIVDYVGSGGEKLGREMRYVSETTEGERVGDWPPPPATMRTHRLHKYPGFPEATAAGTATASAAAAAAAARKDAITKKPLDLEEEDEARKFETSKWLESHFGSDSRSSPSSQEAEEPPMNATNTSFINVTMKSSRSPRERDYGSGNRHQRRPESSEYFHGVSEWAERWAIEKQRTSSPCDTAAIKSNGHTLDSRNPGDYAPRLESTRRQEVERQVQVQVQDDIGAPAPPLRRRRDAGRTKSPIQVPYEQRTWEYRRRNQSEIQEEVRQTTLPRSNSNSPEAEPVAIRIPIHREKKATKSSGQAKYKIGESFRKLVGKLRSASAERKGNKRSGNGSTSQLTQTDDDDAPSYMQYNVIDRNIPLVSDEFDGDSKQPQPRATSTPCAKIPRSSPSNPGGETVSPTVIPVQRYYLGENPFAGSIYGRERGYKDPTGTGRRSAGNRPAKAAMRSMEAREYSTVETSSLGRRLSKSTSRLTGEYEMEEQQRYRSTQTLPRKSRHVTTTTTTTTTMPVARRITETRHGILRDQDELPIGRKSSPSTSSCRRQYDSMINISIKNAVKQPLRSPPVEERIIPVKPERTYKSSLARSKSFTVDADTGSGRTPHASNTQLNRLDETPPLKSPGILASINRSSRDLFKQDRY